MSIVLVIISLIVGGVLVGQDLIRSAYVRAEISQIEKYNTAVNTFYGKYQALPGDMNAQVAQTYNFAARGSNPGQGDGNGLIQGWDGTCPTAGGSNIGESGMFWVDLSQAGLIDGGFVTATSSSTGLSYVNGTQISLYFPTAKIGSSNYIYVWNGGSAIQESECQNPGGGGRRV